MVFLFIKKPDVESEANGISPRQATYYTAKTSHHYHTYLQRWGVRLCV